MKVKLAPGKEVLKVTGYSVGSVALVGGTGEPTYTLKINADALGKLNQIVAVLD